MTCLQFGTAHILRLAVWKRYFWASKNWPAYSTAQSISERYAAWKLCFCTSANRILSRTALPMYERFQGWKSDYCASENRPPCRTALPIVQRFAAWKRDLWGSANRPSCRMALLISERFAASRRFPNHHKIDPFCSTVQPISNRKKMRFLNFNNSTPIYACVAAWKRKYIAVENHLLAGRHCPYMIVPQTENAIPEN